MKQYAKNSTRETGDRKQNSMKSMQKQYSSENTPKAALKKQYLGHSTQELDRKQETVRKKNRNQETEDRKQCAK